MSLRCKSPSEAMMRQMRKAYHQECFACRPKDKGGLGLDFRMDINDSVVALWQCPSGMESYKGILHGGILATVLDCSMVNALFARGIAAKTGELNVRYKSEVKANLPISVSAKVVDSRHPFYQMEAVITQDEKICAKAVAKFMAIESYSHRGD